MKGLVIVSVIVWGLLWVSPCWARPLVTDDAGVVEPGKLEIEAGGGQDSFKEAKHGSVPVVLTYGLVQGLEAGTEVSHLISNPDHSSREKGVGDLKVAIKYQFVQERKWWPTLSLSTTLKLPTASRKRGLGTGRTDVTLNGILSKGIGPTLVYLNCGYTFVSRSPGLGLRDILHGGLAMEWRLKKRVTAVMEVHGFSRSEEGGKNQLETHAGLLFRVRPDLVLDAALGRGLRSRSVGPDLHATLGLTWTFGF